MFTINRLLLNQFSKKYRATSWPVRASSWPVRAPSWPIRAPSWLVGAPSLPVGVPSWPIRAPSWVRNKKNHTIYKVQDCLHSFITSERIDLETSGGNQIVEEKKLIHRQLIY